MTTSAIGGKLRRGGRVRHPREQATARGETIVSRRGKPCIAVVAVMLAGAGSGTAVAATTPPTDTDPATAPSLAGVCPETIVVQTDWYPEAEHGWLYELVGDDPVIDAGTASLTGPLVAGDVDTGVAIEIRSGGSAIDFQPVPAVLHADDDVLLGYVNTDEAIQHATDLPTVAIFNGLERFPQMIMWDPETYPEVETIVDLGEEGITVLHLGGDAWVDYFTQTGILAPEQLDASYDGTPATFTAEEGRIAQQGFGSAEPYIWEHEVAEWGRPVAYDYVADHGWDTYAESLATRPENVDAYAECFAALVPVVQQATVDFLSDPDATNELIVEAVAIYDTGWVYSSGVAAYAVETMLVDGLIGNGHNDTIGDFDLDRVDALIATAAPVYTSLGQAPPDDLTAADLVTNAFIDPTIALPDEP